MRTVVNRIPDAEGWIAGPEEEDQEYVQECRKLTENLGLTSQVRFLGFQKVEDLFPRMGLLILSSISEAQPLVVLEGFASGVPVVTTDVGACRELIYGQGPGGDGLGTAGAVVPMANPVALAEAALSLLEHPHQWHAAREAGIRRVQSLYTQSTMIEAYRKIYRGALEEWQASALSSGRS
jgi:glycosyltransferase involved in cell wall biosynthesis